MTLLNKLQGATVFEGQCLALKPHSIFTPYFLFMWKIVNRNSQLYLLFITATIQYSKYIYFHNYEFSIAVKNDFSCKDRFLCLYNVCWQSWYVTFIQVYVITSKVNLHRSLEKLHIFITPIRQNVDKTDFKRDWFRWSSAFYLSPFFRL